MNQALTDIQVYGYHGCSREVKELLLADKTQFKGSGNQWDWLGDGVYFWENDYVRAERWASEHHQHLGSVLGARISLSSCFDLANSVAREFLPQAYEDMAILYQASARRLPKNVNPQDYTGEENDLVLRYLDRAVMHHLFNTLLPQAQPEVKYGTVRAPFQEGGELYPGSRFFERDHIQICVRDLDCIVELFDPEN